MSKPASMPQSLRRPDHRNHVESGSMAVDGWLPGVDRQPRSTVADEIRVVYSALREAVGSEEGGITWLAATMRKSISTISTRLNRAENSQGETQLAHLDILGHLTDVGRSVFLAALCEAWGYKAPERAQKVVTRDEVLDAFERDAERCGAAGEAQLERVARSLGCDVAAVRRAGR